MKGTISITVLLIALSTAQLRIYQVERPGPGDGVVVTYKNFGSSSVDASSYYVGSDNQRIPIHSTENNSREVSGVGPVVPAGGTWTIDYRPWASQTSGKFTQSSDVSLWASRNPDQNLLDFMQYCNTNQGTTCPDFGSYGRADFTAVWDRTSVYERHVTYVGGFPTFRFLGGANDRGTRFWTSDPTGTALPSTSSSNTKSPTTSSPTGVPTTKSPTSGPTTSSPTASPTTSSSTATPTKSPTASPTTLRPTFAPPAMSDSVPCQVLELDIFQLKVKLGC